MTPPTNEAPKPKLTAAAITAWVESFEDLADTDGSDTYVVPVFDQAVALMRSGLQQLAEAQSACEVVRDELAKVKKREADGVALFDQIVAETRKERDEAREQLKQAATIIEESRVLAGCSPGERLQHRIGEMAEQLQQVRQSLAAAEQVALDAEGAAWKALGKPEGTYDTSNVQRVCEALIDARGLLGERDAALAASRAQQAAPVNELHEARVAAMGAGWIGTGSLAEWIALMHRDVQREDMPDTVERGLAELTGRLLDEEGVATVSVGDLRELGLLRLPDGNKKPEPHAVEIAGFNGLEYMPTTASTTREDQIKGGQVSCRDCGAEGPDRQAGGDLVGRWNRRSRAPIPAEVAHALDQLELVLTARYRGARIQRSLAVDIRGRLLSLCELLAAAEAPDANPT